MRLKKLRLKNFRSYRDVEFDFDNLNVIIGKMMLVNQLSWMP